MENSFAPSLFAKNSQSLISKAGRKQKRQERQQKSTVQISNKQARETSGKMNFVCVRNWPLRLDLFSRVSNLILILLLALALLESPVESWRFFDMTNAETRSFGILHPTTSSMLIQNPQALINLPASNQLTTPSTSSAVSSGNIGGEANNNRNSNSNEISQQELKAGYFSNTEHTNNEPTSTGMSPSLVANSKIPTAGARLDLARDASLLGSDADSLVALAVDATKASHNDQRDDNQRVATGENNPAASVVPSPAGKIISPLLSVAADSVQNSSSSLETGVKQLNAAFQLLKPRKHSNQDANRQLASAEQQIINQHARVHSVGNSHQRFFPTKQRDHKINGAIVDSASNSDNSEREPLSSLLGNFRLGISNRNSIVKAISDNKLARTLSTVGKSISGNKYIAGAAAASALAAALGLGMSKLLSPYLMSGGYSKIADPMMSSGTVLSPSIISYPMDSARTDPTFLYTNPADSMFASASSQQAYLRPQQLSGSFSSDTLDPMSIYETAPTSAVLQQPPASSSLYQTNAYSGLLNSQSISPDQQQQPQIYFTYKPTTLKPPQTKYQYLRPTTSSPSQSAAADTGGHYTNFYDQQGISSQDQLGSSLGQYESTYSSSYEPTVSASLSSSSPLPSSSSISTASPSALPAYSSSRYLQNQANLNPASSVAQIDQMMPAASIESPVFPSAQQQPSNTFSGSGGSSIGSGTTGELFNQAYSFMPTVRQSSNTLLSTPRRSGTVALKMDEATRNRLIQTIRQHQMLIPGISNELGSSSASIAGYSTPSDKLSTNKPAFDSIVPMTTKALTDMSAGPVSEYFSAAAKSSRAETGSGNKNQYASPTPSKPQQGQLVPKSNPAVTYLLISPKTNQPDSFVGGGERQKETTATETNGARLSLSQQQMQQQARQSPWRSFDGETQQSQSQQTQAWQSLEGTSKQTSGDNRIERQQQQQWQLPTNDVQQVSQVATNGRVGGISGNAANANGQQQQEVPLHRVSRTPNQSSVIQASPSALATGGAHTTTPNSSSRQHTPIESLTDYESEMSNGANVGVARSSSSSQSSLGAAESTNASSERQPASSLAANGQNFAPTSEGAASTSRTNLILRPEESDKNNDIKLIEANTKGSDKLTSLVDDSVLAVPGNRVSYIPRNEDNIALAANDNGQRQQKLHRNHHQQPNTSDSIETTGKSSTFATGMHSSTFLVKDEEAELPSLRVYSGSLASGALL